MVRLVVSYDRKRKGYKPPDLSVEQNKGFYHYSKPLFSTQPMGKFRGQAIAQNRLSNLLGKVNQFGNIVDT